MFNNHENLVGFEFEPNNCDSNMRGASASVIVLV